MDTATQNVRAQETAICTVCGKNPCDQGPAHWRQSSDGQLLDYVGGYYVEQRNGVWCVVTRNGCVVTTVPDKDEGEALVARWDRNRHGS